MNPISPSDSDKTSSPAPKLSEKAKQELLAALERAQQRISQANDTQLGEELKQELSTIFERIQQQYSPAESGNPPAPKITDGLSEELQQKLRLSDERLRQQCSPNPNSFLQSTAADLRTQMFRGRFQRQLQRDLTATEITLFNMRNEAIQRRIADSLGGISPALREEYARMMLAHAQMGDRQTLAWSEFADIEKMRRQVIEITQIHPVFHHFYQLYQAGEISYEQAMLQIVLSLVQQNCELANKLSELLLAQPCWSESHRNPDKRY